MIERMLVLALSTLLVLGFGGYIALGIAAELRQVDRTIQAAITPHP